MPLERPALLPFTGRVPFARDTALPDLVAAVPLTELRLWGVGVLRLYVLPLEREGLLWLAELPGLRLYEDEEPRLCGAELPRLYELLRLCWLLLYEEPLLRLDDPLLRPMLLPPE